MFKLVNEPQQGNRSKYLDLPFLVKWRLTGCYAVDKSFVQSQVGRLPSILSESKPVSYSWFPAKVGPKVINLGG
jgi:hypothetical protein